MQYPMRPVDLLKQLLPQSTDVIFVDNEKKFKELVAQESYDYYFIDRFAGDFGHCTPKGNQLIAEHLADIIFKNL